MSIGDVGYIICSSPLSIAGGSSKFSQKEGSVELPGSGYLYTIAALAMTFVGFTSIVLVFRQDMKASAITAVS